MIAQTGFLFALLVVLLQAAAEPVPPDQVEKNEPVPGVAVSVTWLPARTEVLHWEVEGPQSMMTVPALFFPLTVPVPLAPRVTARVTCGARNWAFSEESCVRAKLQGEVLFTQGEPAADPD